MNILNKFTPEVFNTLSTEEKKIIIITLSHILMHNLKLESIPIVFGDASKDNKIIAGKHMHGSPFILINNFFLEDKEYQSNTINYDIYKPYYLVHTIAHECFHHYQYIETQKLINNHELSQQDKDYAYLYFVCLYSDLFSSLNDKLHFSSLPEMDKNDLYLYSPIEIEANSYGNKLVDSLSQFDNIESFEYYHQFQIGEQFNFINHNRLNGGNLTIKSIDYNLQLAVDFINYKNKENGIKHKYLGIDINELQESVNRAKKKWIKQEKIQTEFLNKIFKK